MTITDNFITNHNALTQATKGAAPGVQILWVAAILTIFETIVAIANPQLPKQFFQNTKPDFKLNLHHMDSQPQHFLGIFIQSQCGIKLLLQ